MRGSAVNSSKVNGPGSHRMGWLGWAGWLAGLGWAGLQRADLRSAEIFHALRPRPAGCGAAANYICSKMGHSLEHLPTFFYEKSCIC